MTSSCLPDKCHSNGREKQMEMHWSMFGTDGYAGRKFKIFPPQMEIRVPPPPRGQGNHSSNRNLSLTGFPADQFTRKTQDSFVCGNAESRTRHNSLPEWFRPVTKHSLRVHLCSMRQEKCSDFSFCVQPTVSLFGATHFPHEKWKKCEQVFLNREDFNFLWDR